jgi:hypothetical protein
MLVKLIEGDPEVRPPSRTTRYPLFSTHAYLAKYPVFARTVIASRFGLIAILRNESSFNGSFG